MALITEANNPTLWATLNAQWLREDEPGYIASGNSHYTVVKEHPTGKVAFEAFTDETAYETSSLEAMT